MGEEFANYKRNGPWSDKELEDRVELKKHLDNYIQKFKNKCNELDCYKRKNKAGIEAGEKNIGL